MKIKINKTEIKKIGDQFIDNSNSLDSEIKKINSTVL